VSGNEAVNVRILDREYTVGVEPGERDSLMAAARLLDQRMRDARGANRMTAIDRVAVLAALNLAHELEQLREDNARRDKQIARALDALERKLDQAGGIDDQPAG
jgi:cell division protein ZapA